MDQAFLRKTSVLLFPNCVVSSRRAAENAEEVSRECQKGDKRRAKEAKFEQSVSLGHAL